MHIPKVRLNQLIRGNRGVTPDTALRLADLTGTSGVLDEPAVPVRFLGGPRRRALTGRSPDSSAREGQLETLALQSRIRPGRRIHKAQLTEDRRGRLGQGRGHQSAPGTQGEAATDDARRKDQCSRRLPAGSAWHCQP